MDGFLGGMATDFKEGWKDGACQDRSEIGEKFKHVLRNAKQFWHAIKSIHKKVWTSTGRKHLLDALKGLLKALVIALKSVWKFATTCPAVAKVGKMLGVIVGMVILNLAFLAAGLVVVPLLIKSVGALIGLGTSLGYIKTTIETIYKEVKRIKVGECTTSCKKTLIEKSSALLGAIVEVLLQGDVAKFSKVKGTTSLFKKYKVKRSKTLINDIKQLKNHIVRGKIQKTKDVPKKTFFKKIHLEIDSVPDNMVKRFASNKINDNEFLKKVGVDPTDTIKRLDAENAFKESLLKSEKGRQDFVQLHGADFKDSIKLKKQYWDKDMDILLNTFKREMKAKKRYTDEEINDIAKKLFDFDENGAGREWGNEFATEYLGRKIIPDKNIGNDFINKVVDNANEINKVRKIYNEIEQLHKDNKKDEVHEKCLEAKKYFKTETMFLNYFGNKCQET